MLRSLLIALLCVPALLAEAPATPPPAGLAAAAVDAATAYARAEGEKSGGEFHFTLVQAPSLPTFAGKVAFSPSHLSKREPVGHFFVVLSVLAEGRRVAMARVDLEGRWKGTLLRAGQDMPRKSTPEAGQVEPFTFEGVPPEGALAAVPEGWRLRNAVTKGKILVRTDLEPIPLVQAGDKVRLTASSGPLVLTQEVVARGQGAMGSRVRLEVPGSKKQLTGVVTGPGEARLEL